MCLCRLCVRARVCRVCMCACVETIEDRLTWDHYDMNVSFALVVFIGDRIIGRLSRLPEGPRVNLHRGGLLSFTVS